MALILDKTATGITSTIIVSGTTDDFVESGYTQTEFTNTGWIETAYSGNTYVRTTYATGYTYLLYTDDFGNTYDNPYMVVDLVTINKLSKFAEISISIYRDSESRKNLKKPISEKKHGCISTLYDMYFSMPVMSNINIFKSAYDYIDDIYTGWKSDE